VEDIQDLCKELERDKMLEPIISTVEYLSKSSSSESSDDNIEASD